MEQLTDTIVLSSLFIIGLTMATMFKRKGKTLTTIENVKNGICPQCKTAQRKSSQKKDVSFWTHFMCNECGYNVTVHAHNENANQSTGDDDVYDEL